MVHQDDSLDDEVNTIEYIGGAVSMFIALISISLSALTLYIIKKTGKWNGFIVLVWSLTISQMIYDFTFALIFPNEIVYYCNIFISTFGGVSVTFWTNVMSGIVVYMVYTSSTVNSGAMYKWYFLLCTILPLCYAIISDSLLPFGYLRELDISYNFIRLVSIGLNFLAYACVLRKTNKLTAAGKLPAEHPLIILISRLKYYPIVQIICRLWPSVYELQYGNRVDHAAYNTTNPSSDVEFLLYAFFLPSAGIGYFIVFLAVQPQAYATFKGLWCSAKREGSEAYSFESGVFAANESFHATSFTSGAGPASNAPLLLRREMDEDELTAEIQEINRSDTLSKDSL